MKAHVARPSSIIAAACIAALSVAGAPASGHTQGGGPRGPADHGNIAYTNFDPSDEDAPSKTQVVSTATLQVHTIAGYGADPHWSPDGQQVAVGGCASTSPNCVATVVRPNGQTIRELPMPNEFPADTTAFEPVVWSPNGHWLAGGVDSDQGDLNGIYLIPASGGEGMTRVTSNPGGEDIPGSFSPDGHWLVFVRNIAQDGDLVADGLYLVRPDGSHLHRLTPPGTLVNAEHGGRWSPDGRTILFDARPNPDSRFTLWTIRPNGENMTRIQLPLACGAPSNDPTSFGCFAPAWSPNGRDIVFGTNNTATGARDLYSASSQGTRLRKVTNLGTRAADAPDWGP